MCVRCVCLVSLRASSDVCLKLAQVIALNRDPRPSPARRETRATLSELLARVKCALTLVRDRTLPGGERGECACAVCAPRRSRREKNTSRYWYTSTVYTCTHTPCTARSGKLYEQCEQEWGVSQHMGSAQMAWQVQYPSYRHGHRPARARHGLHTHCPGASRRLRASARARAACTPRET